ncbi:unnamed protein product, partial [Pleuronectes platessa]
TVDAGTGGDLNKRMLEMSTIASVEEREAALINSHIHFDRDVRATTAPTDEHDIPHESITRDLRVPHAESESEWHRVRSQGAAGVVGEAECRGAREESEQLICDRSARTEQSHALPAGAVHSLRADSS